MQLYIAQYINPSKFTYRLENFNTYFTPATNAPIVIKNIPVVQYLLFFSGYPKNLFNIKIKNIRVLLRAKNLFNLNFKIN